MSLSTAVAGPAVSPSAGSGRGSSAGQNAFRISWYRLARTLRQHWTGYVSLVVLIGLVGGIGLGGLAAARRTQSSFSVYLKSTNPSDLFATVYGVTTATKVDGVATLARQIAHLPGVGQVRAGAVLRAAPLSAAGVPNVADTQIGYSVASENGLFFTRDRVSVVEGKMADPAKADEIMMPANVAEKLGFRLGQIVPWAFVASTSGSSPSPSSAIRRNMKLVGLIAFNTTIVQDDIDQFPSFILFTPAMTRELTHTFHAAFSNAATYGIQVRRHASVAEVEAEITRVLPSNSVTSEHTTASVVAKADRAVKPIAVALGVFGTVALLAALFIGIQAISRRLTDRQLDREILRALGVTRATGVLEGSLGLIFAVVAGSALAVVVAVALSPVAPLGPVRSVYPDIGLSFDWTVLGPGFAFLAVALSGTAVVMTVLRAPHRLIRRAGFVQRDGSSLTSRAAATGLSASAVVGIRMALEPGSGRTAVPVRSALLAMMLAVSLVVATLTFGSGLQTLVTTPSLYGWNWTYLFNPVGANGSNVPPQVTSALQHDPKVAAWAGLNYNAATIDGRPVPFISMNLGAPLSPPLLSGHTIAANDQIVLGGATMEQLHAHVGGTVVMSYGTKANYPEYVPPTRLRIVGTATFPAVGFSSVVQDHTSMGTGALVSNGIYPAYFQQAELFPYATLNGPNIVLVRARPGVTEAATKSDAARLVRIAARAFAAVPHGVGDGDAIDVVGVQRPAEIVDYRTMGATPALLGAGLALGAVAALAVTLTSSVRRRRRDLALLKALGFTQAQLMAAVAWQASITAVAGLLIGLPLGILAGRWLWILFAHVIYAVPDATVPWGWIGVVIGAALVLANVVAAIPGRMAARTTTGVMLRTE